MFASLPSGVFVRYVLLLVTAVPVFLGQGVQSPDCIGLYRRTRVRACVCSQTFLWIQS